MFGWTLHFEIWAVQISGWQTEHGHSEYNPDVRHPWVTPHPHTTPWPCSTTLHKPGRGSLFTNSSFYWHHVWSKFTKVGWSDGRENKHSECHRFCMGTSSESKFARKQVRAVNRRSQIGNYQWIDKYCHVSSYRTLKVSLTVTIKGRLKLFDSGVQTESQIYTPVLGNPCLMHWYTTTSLLTGRLNILYLHNIGC